MISGLLRSSGVIDVMIASNRPRSVDSAERSFGAAFSILPNGSMPRTWSSGPSWRTWRSWSRKSSSVNASSRSFRTSSSALVWSTASWARSTRESTSPMPRMREASRSGWNGSSASVFLPVPAKAIGRPVTPRTERAAPPRAWPSSVVRITASIPTALFNRSAMETAVWPVLPTTSCEKWLLTLFRVPTRELRGGRRLARALEPDEHDHRRRMGRRGEPVAAAAEELDQLIVDHLDDLLGRRQRPQDVLAHGLLPHAVDEGADDFEVDVGLEEGDAHLAQGLLDVFLRQAAAAAQAVEDRLQARAQGIQHGNPNFTESLAK